MERLKLVLNIIQAALDVAVIVYLVRRWKK